MGRNSTNLLLPTIISPLLDCRPHSQVKSPPCRNDTEDADDGANGEFQEPRGIDSECEDRGGHSA
jgi:hypothetical protein